MQLKSLSHLQDILEAAGINVLRIGQSYAGFMVTSDDREEALRQRLEAAGFEVAETSLDIHDALSTYGVPVCHVTFTVRG